MLTHTLHSGFGADLGGSAQTIFQIIQTLGLTAGLQACCDAGDGASWAGSGNWLDVSGNANDMTLNGLTFNGVVGNRSENEYFLVTGGSGYMSTPSSAYAVGFSKAGGEFTMGGIIRPIGAGNASFCGTADSAADNGVLLRMEGVPNKLGAYWDIANAAGHSVSLGAGNTTAAVPNLGIFGGKDSTTSGKIKLNHQAIDTFVKTASALTNAPQNMACGAFGSGNQQLATNARIYAFFCWNVLLSDANINAFATALSARFPTMP